MLLTTQNGNRNALNLTLPSKFLSFLLLHLKLSTLSTRTRLVDIYGYDNTPSSMHRNSTATTIVYTLSTNHPSLLLNLLITPQVNQQISTKHPSISSIFLTATWLERELGEMHGLFFYNKEDSRNLMLPYGDASTPLQKILPSIGLREIFYDSTTDTITSRFVSIQF